VSDRITIRPFVEDDTSAVRDLFISVNRQLAPPHLNDAFEGCIARSLVEEIDRITLYYRERGGGFWVALQNGRLVGTFGLERAAPDTMELRRMYVNAAVRRTRIARQMLEYAEDECRRRNISASIKRCPGESRGLPFGLTASGSVDPGFRRESALVAVSSSVGRQRRWATRNNMVRQTPYVKPLPRRKPGPTFPALGGRINGSGLAPAQRSGSGFVPCASEQIVWFSPV